MFGAGVQTWGPEGVADPEVNRGHSQCSTTSQKAGLIGFIKTERTAVHARESNILRTLYILGVTNRDLAQSLQ